jgi:SAM-dependent methyltransferase
MSTDHRRVAPSVARNRDPIWTVLQSYLPASGVVLEIASGSGEHTLHFSAPSADGLLFQPSDPDADARLSIDAWVETERRTNVMSALALDAASDHWPIARADAVVCINMIHIAPWAATLGLLRGAARILPVGGLLYLYGPYRRNGTHTSDSNLAFDLDLKARNSAWGVRDLDDVAAEAARVGFLAPLVEAMPANNLSVMFRRAP